MGVRESVPVVVMCVMVFLFGVVIAVGWRKPIESCLDRYDRARTAADSARVDLTGKTARSRVACGDLRRDGTLERHRQTVERRRAADAAAAGPLMEK